MTQMTWYPQPITEYSEVIVRHDPLGRLIIRDGVASSAPEVVPISKPTRTMGWGDCRHPEGKECRNCK